MLFRTILSFTFFFCLACSNSFAQVKAIDKLEIFYDQGHYRLVYRKANLLLDKPDYDYSMQPEFYKSLAMFQLSRNELWANRHSNSLQEARKLFLDVKSSVDGMKVFNAHIDHVTALKKMLTKWVEELRAAGEQDKFDELQQILFGLFDYVPELDNPFNYTQPVIADDTDEIEETGSVKKRREEMVNYAKAQLGVPYLWSGTDPKGFDCSGFTTYIMKSIQQDLPRRAEDQYSDSRKVKQRNVQKGDLVFFNNGEGISHVGMIISPKGAPLVMIHASSSKGIVITEIETSEYWLKRLYGFGTYVK